MATPTAQTEPALQLPAPDPAPAAPTAQQSTLAQFLAPVQPARPVGDGHAQPLGSTSSLPQDAGGDTASSSGGRGQGADREGPVAALVRALAGRLRRTGTATSIKRSHDVKETRVSGNSSTTTNANKTDRSAKNEQSAQHRSNCDAKLADLNNKSSQHQGKDSRDVKKADTSDAKTSDARASKADTASKSSNSKDSRDNRDAKSLDSKTAKSGADTKDHRDTSAKSSDSKAAKADTSAKTSDAKTSDAKGSDSRTAKTDTPAKTSDPKGLDGKTAEADTGVKGADGKTTPAAAGTETGAQAKTKDDAARPVSLTKTEPDKDAASPTQGQAPDSRTAAVNGTTTPTSPLRTRSSREAGYRDGQRAAAAVGHVKAWRDGTRDGWDDRQAADQNERKKMDDARARNAIRPKTPAGPQMAPASGSTADLIKKTPTTPATPVTSVGIPPKPTTPPTTPAQTTAPAEQAPAQGTAPVPAQVTDVGEKAIQFNADGAQHSMTRGEVRTLKQFERRMAAKKTALTQITEGSKTTREQAVEHATRAQRLAEDAKAVKGGDTLVSVLLRLAERAQLLRGKVEEIEKTSTRGAEAVGVLVANAETRHGGIYKAVVDSPLTTPAEREFYQDKQGS